MKPSNKPLPTPVEWQIKKVGIALAAYKPDPVYFEMQLKSIQDQTFSNWNCWITLDSSLGELKKLPVLEPFFNDPRFIWSENTSRLGHKKNFEHAMNLAAADPSVDAIACSDQDDVWYPEKLSESVAELQKRGRLSLVHCDMHVMDSIGNLKEKTAWTIEKRGVHNATTETLLIRNIVAGCAMLIDAALVKSHPHIPEEFEFHDHWYAVVASLHTGAHPISKALYAYRQHEQNVVGVTPFQGLLTVPTESRNLNSIVDKLRKGSRKSILLTLATRRHIKLRRDEIDPQLGAHSSSGLFRGIRLLLLAIQHISSDPPFARASLARGVGAVLTE